MDTPLVLSGALIHVVHVGKSIIGVTQAKMTRPSGTTAPHKEEFCQYNTLSKAPSAHQNVGRMEKIITGAIRVLVSAIQKAAMISGTTAALASTKHNTERSVRTAAVGKEKTTIGARQRMEAGIIAHHLHR